jgi:hypothetical protein
MKFSRMTRNRVRVAVAAVVVLVGSPVAYVAFTAWTPPAPTVAAPTNVLHRLYFGRSLPSGGQVSEQQWSAFLAQTVTPRFPGGFTTWPALGQWRQASGGIVREPTFVFEVAHPADTRTADDIQAIIQEYKRRFRQESVLWIRERVDVSF